MGEYLPGNMQQRLKELRIAAGIKSQNKLAEIIGVDRSTYSRLESGQIQTISSDILINLSKLYKVPTDYILGLTDIPENTGFDIKELGLSIEAAKRLYTKKVSPRVINALLANDKFASAVRMIDQYFTFSVADLIRSQNNLLDNSVNILDELIKTGRIPNNEEMREARKRIKSAKLPKESYELDRIQHQLMAAVREIKKELVNEVAESAADKDKLEFKVMEKVKEEAYACLDLKDLPEDQKVSLIKNTILNGICCYADIDDNKAAKIEPIVEQLALLLIELWKED